MVIMTQHIEALRGVLGDVVNQMHVQVDKKEGLVSVRQQSGKLGDNEYYLVYNPDESGCGQFMLMCNWDGSNEPRGVCTGENAVRVFLACCEAAS
jgi:hypothetical protein